MNWKQSVIPLIVALAVGCTSSPPKSDSAHWVAPAQAVQLAAASPRLGVKGVFSMTVKATGKTDRVHLNSELDYRDQRNLSIAVERRAAEELAIQLGEPPERALKGKQIIVTGTAKRTKIVFFADGKPTDKYYYQTHVAVTRASQIQVL
ncbi:hypothetical protein ACW7G0_14165 [Lysobacter sp. A286]